MHHVADHFEIALTLASQAHGTQRIVCASHDKLGPGSEAFHLIADGKEPFPIPRDVVLPTETVDAELTLDAVLLDGRPVPFDLHKKTLCPADLGTAIKWWEPPQRKLPERLVIRPTSLWVAITDQDNINNW